MEKNKVNNLILSFKTLALLTLIQSGCGTSKSSQTINTTPQTSNVISSEKQFARCNKSVDSNISLNLNAIISQTGISDPNWVKLKFNFLSTTATQNGNTVRFFKWKSTDSQTYLDPTPLGVQIYDLTTGQPTTNLNSSLSVDSLSQNQGLYIQLNDPQAVYQVLKTVIYDSSGKIVTQMNTLIPEFYSNVADYKLNTNGSIRPEALVSLHPLNTVQTTTWTSTEYKNYFESFCF